MMFMLTACLFGLPAFYLAQSKGFRGGWFLVSTIILTFITQVVGPHAIVYDPVILTISLLINGVPLLIAFMMPARPGAPGRAYLTIRFDCPECSRPLAFPRHREGMPVLCPECEEIITVPKDEFSPPETPAVKHEKPAPDKGVVVFETFGSESAAMQLNALLNDSGIKAFISSDNAGGLMPQLGMTQGYAVHIDAAQWEEADQLRQQNADKSPGISPEDSGR